jgi:preprotein translocase subunit SecY
MNLLKQIWMSSSLQKKILFTIAALFIYRVFAQISIPGVDVQQVRDYFSELGGAISIYFMLTGGSMEKFSIVLMGLGPYINASIIMQLATVVIPKLEMLQKEGQAGQRKISQYTRWLTVIFSLAMSYGMIAAVLPPMPIMDMIPLMVIATAGTLFLMWLGEVISERGLGNGISLLIMASLVANIPSVIANILQSVGSLSGNTGKLIPAILFFIVAFILIVLTILATEGQRKIPVNYGTGGNAMASSLPIRVLQAGMIPIIFALSLITFPSVLVQIWGQGNDLGPVAQFFVDNFDPENGTVVFFITYFFLIVFFSYFYVSITFKADQIAENIQKKGGFVPGYRPGSETVNHISEVSFRLLLWGGSFLAFVAIVPMLFTVFSDTLTSKDLIISGSGIVIIVGVVLDLIRRINDQLSNQNYDELK